MVQPVDVLVFDSGVGGLTILDELMLQQPQLSYAYVSDTEGLPYGNKETSWLLDRVSQVFDQVLQRVQPRLAVIACNTASTLVLPFMRTRCTFPIVGVVPAIKPAATLSRSRVIGLLATPATVARGYTDHLIREFAGHCRVIRVGSSELVEAAERKLRGGSLDLESIAHICQPLQDSNLDVLVLGCTHFPLLRDELRQILSPHVTFVDSGTAVAQRVAYLLDLDQSHQVVCGSLPSRAFFTALDDDCNKLARVLQGYGLQSLEAFSLPS